MLSLSKNTYPRESAGDVEAEAAEDSGFDTVGVQAFGNQARLLFGRAPYCPRVAVPLARIALSGDAGDLVGYLKSSGASISQLASNAATVDQLTSTNINAHYVNADGADINIIQNQQIDTESITTLGQEIYVDWYATSTKLPAVAIQNNPLQTGYNSDGQKGNFSIGSMLISAGEAAATDALLYFGKQGAGWLMSLGQDAFSLFSGYASLSEAGMSLGGSAASLGAAAGGDAAIFAAGESGMVLASTASEAASLFSSAGVLAEGGVGFSSELGEVAQGLLTGVENSSGSFVEEAMPDFFDTLLGTGRWVSL